MSTQRSQYVEHMRDKFFDWTEKVLSGAVRFLDVCIKKTATGSMKEYIRLAEDFILCEALETKWSVEVRHKCSCPLFFGKGQCEHVVLLAMLAAPTEVLLPNRSDLRQIRSRAGKKRGRPAGDGDSDRLTVLRSRGRSRRNSEQRRNQPYNLHSCLILRVRYYTDLCRHLRSI